MATIRQDQAQLIITIDAKESQEYQKVLQASAKGVADIKKLEVGTKEFNAALEQQVAISKKLAAADYSKLSLKQLQDRRSQLAQLQRILPAVSFAEQGFEKELKAVNTQLSINAQRTRAVNTAMGSTGNMLKTIMTGIIRFAAPTAILAGITAIGKKAIQTAANFETTTQSFAVLLGSMAKAKDLLKDLTSFSLATPFDPTEIQDAAKTLLGFGRTAKDVKKDIEIIGTAAAATGAPLKSLSLVFGQVAGVGKLLGNDVLQFINAGVPVYQILADHLKVSVSEVKKLQEQGKITFDVLRQSFQEAAEDGGKFAGALEKQSKTLNGLMSTAKGVASELLVAFGSKLSGFMSRSLSGLISFGRGLKEIIAPTKTVAQETRELQQEFNNEIGVLKRLSPHAEGRKELIEQINEKYKEYLPNLIKESDGIKEIEMAQKAANKVFQEKLIFLAFEEEYKKQIDKTKQAIKNLAGAELARAKSAQDNVQLGQFGATAGQLEQQKKVNEQFASLVQDNAQQQIDANDKVISELEDAYDKTAKRIGSSLDAIRNKFAATTAADGPSSPKAPTDESKEAKAAREKREKEFKKLVDERRKQIKVLLALNWQLPMLAPKALDYEVNKLEEATKKELSILEEAFLKGNMSKEQYEVEKLRISQNGYVMQLELLDKFNQEESDKRRAINIEYLKSQKALVEERARQIGALDNSELTTLEESFAQKLIAEEEYNLSRLEVQMNFLDMQLQMLEESGLKDTDVYKQIYAERLKAQIAFNKQAVENEERTAMLKEAIQKEGFSVASDLFSLGADLLGQDEKRRKKHASAIKAFESANVLINAISEIAEYAKTSAKFGPILGPILAAARGVFATVRAGIAISKINAQTFAGGGQIKTVSGQLINEAPNMDALPNGDNVLIAAKPGEVVLNTDQQAALGGADTFRRIDVPGFNNGGIIPSLPSTTPVLSPTVLSRNTVVNTDSSNAEMSKALNAMVDVVSSLPNIISKMNLKTHVVYNDIEKAGDLVDEIKRLSSY